MGISMYSIGSSLSFIGDEQVAVQEIKIKLLEVKDYDRYYRAPDLDLIRSSSTLEEIFFAFHQCLVRDEDGNIIANFGYDDVYYEVDALFEAIAPYLEDNSWYIIHQDNSNPFALIIKGGAVTREYADTSSYVDEENDWEGDKLLERVSSLRPNRKPQFPNWSQQIQAYSEVFNRFVE